MPKQEQATLSGERLNRPPLTVFSAYMKSSGGGAFKVHERVLRRLSDEGQGVIYLAPTEFSLLGESNARFVRVPGSGSVLGFVRFVLGIFLWSLFRAKCPTGSVVVAQGAVYAVALRPLRWKGAKVVTFVHGDFLRETKLNHPGVLSRIAAGHINYLGLHGSDLILAVSEDLAGITRRQLGGCAGPAVVVQPNNIPALPVIDQGESDSLRAVAGLKDRLLLCFVGPLKPIKRVDILLRAVAIMSRSAPVSLWVIGSGPEEERLKDLARELEIEDAVHFLGWQSDPYLHMAAADMLVLCSEYEGSPIVLLEALGVGTPAVGSRVGGIPDMLGDNRLMFEPGDPEALASCIRSLLDDDGRIKLDIREYWAKRRPRFDFDWGGQVVDLIASHS